MARARLSDFAYRVRTEDVTPVSISIVGHTDSTGSITHNNKLSMRRAIAIADFLVSQGLNKNIMRVSGKGESEPVTSNTTKAGRAANRRVEITVSGRKFVEKQG